MKTQHARNQTQPRLSSPSRLNRHTWLALVGWLSISGVVPAAYIAWTNTAGGNWSAAANWSPNQVPGGTDNAYLTNAGTYMVTVSADAAVNALTLGGPTGTQTLNLSGGTFTLNGPGSGNAQAVLSVSGGTLGGSGLLVLAAPLTWTRGTISGAVWCNGGSVSGGADVTLGGGNLINGGTLDMSGLSGLFRTQGGGVISNLAGARFILPANSSIHQNDYQPATIYNYGWMGMSARGGHGAVPRGGGERGDARGGQRDAAVGS